MTRTRRRPPAGFTLIELLVVIGLLAVLTALAAGTYFRVRTAQQESATERIMLRLTTGLERLAKATLDQARQDVREDRPTAAAAVRLSRVWEQPATLPPGEPDRDRAAAIQAYLLYKSQMPQTFDEAALGVEAHQPNVAGGAGPLVPLVAPKPGFRTMVGYAPITATTGRWNVLLRTPDPGSPQRDYALEAAVVLHHILSERGVRGELPGDEIAGSQEAEVTTDYAVATQAADGTITLGARQNGLTLKVFKDVTGTPISFVRFAQNYDIQTVNPNGGAPVDPFDPQGRLRVLLAGTVLGWGDVAPNPNVFRAVFLDALRYQPVPVATAYATPPATTAVVFPGGAETAVPATQQRWVTTLVAGGSAQTRRKWDALNDAIEAAVTGTGSPSGRPSVLVTLPTDAPYQYSYAAR